MKFAPYADNVLVRLDPLGEERANGIKVVELQHEGRKGRWGTVLASGPGYYRDRVVRGGATLGDHTAASSVLVPNETKAGDRVYLPSQSGDVWKLDFSVPRHNKSADFAGLFDISGEVRMVRESEILLAVSEE